MWNLFSKILFSFLRDCRSMLFSQDFNVLLVLIKKNLFINFFNHINPLSLPTHVLSTTNLSRSSTTRTGTPTSNTIVFLLLLLGCGALASSVSFSGTSSQSHSVSFLELGIIKRCLSQRFGTVYVVNLLQHVNQVQSHVYRKKPSTVRSVLDVIGVVESVPVLLFDGVSLSFLFNKKSKTTYNARI